MSNEQTVIEQLTQHLSSHAGVERASVALGLDDSKTASIVAYVVPHARHSACVRRACALQARPIEAGLSLYEPDDDLAIVQKNRRETDYLHSEIFKAQVYAAHGISLPPRARVVDVGANIGMFAVFASRWSPGARILSIEPVAPLAAAITANAFIEAADIAVINCAVGQVSGTADYIYYPNNTVMSGRYADATEDQQNVRGYLKAQPTRVESGMLEEFIAERMGPQVMRCEVKTLSQIVDEQGLEHIDLLKVDVEKSEFDVVSGLRSSDWGRVAQVVLEVHDDGHRVAAISNLLEAQGFSVVRDRDQHLSGTNCVNLYAVHPRRVRAGATSPPREFSGWRTGRRLAADLASAHRNLIPRGIPFECIMLDELPVGQHGSVELATYRRARAEGLRFVDGGEPPRTATERLLAGLWRELLEIEQVTVETDFFAAGGSSLRAVLLLWRVRELFGEGMLSAEAFFQCGRLGAVARFIDAQLERSGDRAEDSEPAAPPQRQRVDA